MLIQAKTRNNWIVAASFLEVCTETIFCKKWVTVSDFVTELNPESSFTGDKLNKALLCKTHV